MGETSGNEKANGLKMSIRKEVKKSTTRKRRGKNQPTPSLQSEATKAFQNHAAVR